MKARVGRGRGAAGLMRYLMDEGMKATGLKRPEIVGGTLAGTGAGQLTRELTAVRELRPDVKRHLWHTSLALPPGEKLTVEKWEAIARDFMQEMQFPEDTAWTAIRHHDTDHDHIHIVACRISLSGGVWLGQWEVPKAIEATQALERRHGLTITKGLYDDEHKRRPADRAQKSLTPAEINQAVRTDEEPPRQRLQRLVDAAAEGSPTVVEFAERLTLAGVSVRANVASTGRMNGFSFEIEGIPFKGSDLGKQYTWKGLQDRGITYEQVRDRAGLERFKPAAVTDRAVDPATTAKHQRVAEFAGAAGQTDGANAGATPAVAAGDGEQYQGGLGAAPRSATADRTNAARDGYVAVSGSERDGESIGSVGDAEARREPSLECLRSSDGASATVAGLTSIGDDEPRGGSIRVEDAKAKQTFGRSARQSSGFEHDYQQDRQLAGPVECGDGQPGDRLRESNQGGDQSAPAPMEASRDSVTGSGTGRRSGGIVGGDWASRFRKASAEKRRAENGELGQRDLEQGHPTRARVDSTDRQSSREVDPSNYLESHGFEVVRDGTGGPAFVCAN